eukprot:365578-Chlamydomonas_euryale.AAC.18
MGCGTSTPIANPGSPADSEPGNLHEKCFSSADCRAQDLEAARDTKNVAPSQSIASLLPPSSLQKQGANAEDSDFFSNELSLEDNMHDLPFDGATHHGAPRPFNEAARMSALKSLCVLDTVRCHCERVVPKLPPCMQRVACMLAAECLELCACVPTQWFLVFLKTKLGPAYCSCCSPRTSALILSRVCAP